MASTAIAGPPQTPQASRRLLEAQQLPWASVTGGSPPLASSSSLLLLSTGDELEEQQLPEASSTPEVQQEPSESKTPLRHVAGTEQRGPVQPSEQTHGPEASEEASPGLQAAVPSGSQREQGSQGGSWQGSEAAGAGPSQSSGGSSCCRSAEKHLTVRVELPRSPHSLALQGPQAPTVHRVGVDGQGAELQGRRRSVFGSSRAQKDSLEATWPFSIMHSVWRCWEPPPHGALQPDQGLKSR